MLWIMIFENVIIFFFFSVKLNFGWLLTIYVLFWKKYKKKFFLLFQTRPEGCLYLERARDNYQNYDFESRLTVRIHSALRYYTLLTQGKWLLYCVMCFQISRLFLIKFDKTFSIICSIFLILFLVVHIGKVSTKGLCFSQDGDYLFIDLFLLTQRIFHVLLCAEKHGMPVVLVFLIKFRRRTVDIV